MPTGYTAIIEERDVSFEEFVWRCARNFGAFVMMRDDPLDAPVPEKFEPSDYYEQSLREAEEKVARLERMTSAERTAEGDRLRTKGLAYCKEWLRREIASNNRYNEMLAKVVMWEPPSADHEGLKKFMLDQLHISKNDTSYIEQSLAETEAKAVGQFFADELSEARRHVEYAKRSYAEELERTEGRNRWLAQLRASVPPTF